MTKEPGESTLDTGVGTVAKFKTKEKKVRGGRSKADDIAKKAVSKDDAVAKAVELKGGALTKEESEKSKTYVLFLRTVMVGLESAYVGCVFPEILYTSFA